MSAFSLGVALLLTKMTAHAAAPGAANPTRVMLKAQRGKAAEAPPPKDPALKALHPALRDPAARAERTEIFSVPMVVAGSAMVALSPLVFKFAAANGATVKACNENQDSCDEFGVYELAADMCGVSLIAAGIAVFVIGVQRVPVAQRSGRLTLAPWATPTAAGVSLHLEL